MKKILGVLTITFIYSCTNAVGQTYLNFKPFTRNINFAKANEASVKELLDTTLHKFLSVANDTSSEIHKQIQEEFDLGKSTDRLQSYNYPKKLRKEHVTIQFINSSSENGLLGQDSTWRSESLNAIVFVPVMYEDQHGESIMSVCFATNLEIYVAAKLDGKEEEKPQISFSIKKIDIE